MDKINCKYLNEGRCDLASDHVGFDVSAHENICKACVASEKHGEVNPYVTSQIFWTKKQLGLLPSKPVTIDTKSAPIERQIGNGPGTELHKLIPTIFQRKGCGCKNFAKRMNIWGPAECEVKMEVIVDHIVEKSKQSRLLGWVPVLATRIVAERLIKRAIAKARKKNADTSIAEKFNWFVAVTTAPRENCTLQKSLQSMEIAGFDPVVFAEPGSTAVQDSNGYKVIENARKKGIWHNWLHSCRWALDNSDAEVIMTVQDDALFHPDSKTFAESILWPSEYTGFVSLYTPKHYSLQPHFKTKRRDTGVNRIRTKSLWGACALIWPREVLARVIEHKVVKNWIGAPTRTKNSKVMQKRKEDPSLVANSDTAIGKIMNSMGRYMFFVDPSPVQHISQSSTIAHGDNTGRRNCMRCALWDGSLSQQVPLKEDFEPVSELIF